MPQVELAAAVDPDLERARKAAPRAYSTAEDMLDAERLDFVDIATRPDSHAALVRLAASRNVPVICQKPMAPNWAEAVGMVEAAEAAMIHENWRWQPCYRALKSLIDRGEIGQPIDYWFHTRRNVPALDPLQAGYEVYVVADAVGGTSVDAHQAGGKMISSMQLLCELQRH